MILAQMEGPGHGITLVHLLPVTNHAAVNIHAQDFCKCMFSFLMGIYVRVELLGHRVSLELSFCTYSISYLLILIILFPGWLRRTEDLVCLSN